MDASDELNLWYGSILVGRIQNAFESDRTWFGVLEITIHSDDGDLPDRLLDYIRFCENWNERVRDDSADPAEFERYSDLIASGRWATTNSAGTFTRIADAPVFFVGNELTWRAA